MFDIAQSKQDFLRNGFTTINDVYTSEEVVQILSAINLADTSKDTFRKSAELFAIRQFLKEIPEIKELVFTDKFQSLITQLFGQDFFVVKSIYFDNPKRQTGMSLITRT